MFMIIRPTVKPLINMGMDKSGNQTVSTNVWTLVTGWTIRSGYPDTVITSDGLLIPSGITVNIAAQTYRGGSHAGNQTRIKANGTVIATGAGGTREAGVSLASYTPSVDTLITVEAMATSGLTDRDVVSGGTNSYLTVVKV